MWRSLAAHLLWEQGAGGSNPLIPTQVGILYESRPYRRIQCLLTQKTHTCSLVV